MTNTKRTRGRPKDASTFREGDHRKLEVMADLIAKAPELKPTTAMARIGVTDERTVRRLRRRWSRYGADHLTAARKRLHAANPQTLLEEITVGLAKVVNPAVRDRMKIPGDEVRMLDQYRSLDSLGQLGATIGMVRLASIDSNVARQWRSARDMASRPEFKALKDALGPRPDFAANKMMLATRPDQETMQRLAMARTVLDTVCPGSALRDALQAVGTIDKALWRKP